MPDSLSLTFHHSVNEGAQRLHRTWPSLLATGAVGGIDVSIGVFALLLVKTHSGNEIAAALAFGIGFIALTLANSELFTENFLVPLAAVAAHKATAADVARLWVGTAAMNLVGGLVMVVIFMGAFPELGAAARDVGGHFVERGIGLAPFLGAVVAGIIITLMTWMQLAGGTGGKLVAAVAAAFLLAYGELGHVVVASLEMFAAMATGAAFGPGEWIPLFGQMAVGNAVGGIGLVTVLRLVQVGRHRLEGERSRHLDVEEETLRDSRLLIPGITTRAGSADGPVRQAPTIERSVRSEPAAEPTSRPEQVPPAGGA